MPVSLNGNAQIIQLEHEQWAWVTDKYSKDNAEPKPLTGSDQHVPNMILPYCVSDLTDYSTLVKKEHLVLPTIDEEDEDETQCPAHSCLSVRRRHIQSTGNEVCSSTQADQQTSYPNPKKRVTFAEYSRQKLFCPIQNYNSLFYSLEDIDLFRTQVFLEACRIGTTIASYQLDSADPTYRLKELELLCHEEIRGVERLIFDVRGRRLSSARRAHKERVLCSQKKLRANNTCHVTNADKLERVANLSSSNHVEIARIRAKAT